MKTSILLATLVLSWSCGVAEAQQPATSDSKMAPREVSLSNAETPSHSPFSLNLYSFLYGPALNSTGSGVAPNTFISDREGMNIQNQLGLAYNVNDQFSIAPVLDFELYLTDPSNLYDKPQHLSLSYDSYVRATYANLVDFDLGPANISLTADLRYYVPTSDFSRDTRSLGSVRLGLNPTLQLAHQSWSFTLINFVRYYLQREDALPADPTIGLPRVMYYTGPLVSFQASEHVQFWNLVEATVTYDTQGVANTTDPDRSLFDIEPGVDFKVSDRVTISPYLNWFVNRPISTTSINLMANVSM